MLCNLFCMHSCLIITRRATTPAGTARFLRFCVWVFLSGVWRGCSLAFIWIASFNSYLIFIGDVLVLTAASLPPAPTAFTSAATFWLILIPVLIHRWPVSFLVSFLVLILSALLLITAPITTPTIALVTTSFISPIISLIISPVISLAFKPVISRQQASISFD